MLYFNQPGSDSAPPGRLSYPQILLKSPELKRLRQIERDYALLKEEHALLKKAIRFCSERKRKSSRSSSRTGKPTTSR